MGCDLRATVTGHKRPDIVTANPICFIHTDAAIFAIDEDGVCCYVTSATGEVPRSANRCRGAEYVACLDLTSEEGLVADPRVGATGLFVGRGATQRSALLRTGPITRVEFVEDEEQDEAPVDEPVDSGDVSQVKPIDEIQRRLDDELEELDAIELEPFEVIEEVIEEAPAARELPPPSANRGALPPPPPPPSTGLFGMPQPQAPAPQAPAPQAQAPQAPAPQAPALQATAPQAPAPQAPESQPGHAPQNVTPFTLRAPTPPPRRSSIPAPPSQPAPVSVPVAPAAPASKPTPTLMDSAELLKAALESQPSNEGYRPPSTSDIDLGWDGASARETKRDAPKAKLDLRKTRVGMPIVKLS